jgi:hypothetical protein
MVVRLGSVARVPVLLNLAHVAFGLDKERADAAVVTNSSADYRLARRIARRVRESPR